LVQYFIIDVRWNEKNDFSSYQIDFKAEKDEDWYEKCLENKGF
jgi:hypothetical protein